MVEEQHGYLRNECMVTDGPDEPTGILMPVGKVGKSKTPIARLRFRVDVRPDGRPHVRVFSSIKAVRDCVRGLFTFMFEASPRGVAFEYTLTMTGASLRPVAVDPEKMK